jgi:hypothetical protein
MGRGLPGVSNGTRIPDVNRYNATTNTWTPLASAGARQVTRMTTTQERSAGHEPALRLAQT